MLTYVKETKGLRPKVDEQSSAWVRFPNGKEYLLPVVLRRQILVPVFNEDGSVSMAIQSPDDALAPLVDEFFALVSSVEGDAITMSIKSYSSFMALVRGLIQTNYELADSDLSHLLTVTHDGLSQLFEVILFHLRRG